MIGYLKGTVINKLPGQVILLVGGVGYLVTVTPNLLTKLEVKSSFEAFIHPHIKEDAFDLYGFATNEELNLFKLVMTVSGIGPKTALLVINQGVSEVEGAIKNAEADFFTSIPRLGLKNAQKIIIELKTKLGGLKDLELSGESTENMDAVEALRSMGYSKQEALKAIKSVPADLKIEQKITAALKNMGS